MVCILEHMHVAYQTISFWGREIWWEGQKYHMCLWCVLERLCEHIFGYILEHRLMPYLIIHILGWEMQFWGNKHHLWAWEFFLGTSWNIGNVNFCWILRIQKVASGFKLRSVFYSHISKGFYGKYTFLSIFYTYRSINEGKLNSIAEGCD